MQVVQMTNYFVFPVTLKSNDLKKRKRKKEVFNCLSVNSKRLCLLYLLHAVFLVELNVFGCSIKSIFLISVSQREEREKDW